MKRAVLTMILATLPTASALASGNQDGGVAFRLQNVPNSTTNGSDLIQGDEWTFSGTNGQHVILEMNTRDDFGNGTSGLDPVLILKDPAGNVVDFADDNLTCDPNAVPVCGFQCGRIDTNLPASGKYTIVTRDFNTATTTNKQCNGGSYLLTVQGPVANSLSKAPTVDNGIVGDPPDVRRRLEGAKESGR